MAQMDIKYMLDAIIFDFDGVILDSEPIHYEACCEVLKPLGITISYRQYMEKYLGLADKDMFPRLLKMKDLVFPIQKFIILFNKKHRIHPYCQFK